MSARRLIAFAALAELARLPAGQHLQLYVIGTLLGVSNSYLEQIFPKLRRAGIVQSVRGPGGGYRLGLRADKVTLMQIGDALGEPASSIPGKRINSPAAAWIRTEIGAEARISLSRISLADVVAHSGGTP